MQKFDAGIIGVAIIWAAVILASAMILEGTSHFFRCFLFSVAEQRVE
jgi:hypothetical protein